MRAHGCRPAPHRQREGPRDVRPGRPDPHGRLATGSRRTTSSTRRRSPTRARCSPACRRSGSPRPATSSPTTSCRPPTASPTTSAGARSSCKQAARCSRSSASCAATSPARAGRTTRRPARSRASSCRPACASPSACRRRSSRRRRRPTRATTRRSTSTSAAELVGDRELMAPRARRLDRAVPLRRRARARARRHPRRHEVRVRPRRRRRARRRRRGPHARLLALLAGRRLRARPPAAELRQAVRARLGVGRRGWDKTPPAPALPDDVVAGHARAATSRPTSGSPASRSPPGSRGRRHEGAGPHPPEGGDPRPAGHRRRARAAGARLRRRLQRPRRPAGRARRRGRRAARRDVPASCWPTRSIEDYEIVSSPRREVRRRPLPRLLRRGRRAARCRAGRRGGAAVARATATCRASTRSIVPGGFSYGDYLRVGAIARFSPVMESVIAFARDGGLVLGICNGFQVLCEAGLLPGALLPNDRPALRCRQVERRGRQRRHAVHARVRGGRAAVDPGEAHDRPLLRARRAARRARGRGQVVLRYADGGNPNGSARRHRRRRNEAGNVFGLMPHPEHAVDELTAARPTG